MAIAQCGLEQDGIAKNTEGDRIARGRYQGLNDTHLTEMLKYKEKLEVSRATVRRVLREAGIAAVRKRGVKRHYKRRERKAQEGSLLLWDGSPHRWFGEKFGEWSLMAAIDDATGKLVWRVCPPGGCPELFDLQDLRHFHSMYMEGCESRGSVFNPPEPVQSSNSRESRAGYSRRCRKRKSTVWCWRETGGRASEKTDPAQPDLRSEDWAD